MTINTRAINVPIADPTIPIFGNMNNPKTNNPLITTFIMFPMER
jgi:hypothetical protein